MSLVKYGPVSRGEAEHTGAELSLPVTDFIIDTPHRANRGVEVSYGKGGDNLRQADYCLKSFLPCTRCSHLFHLPRTINMNIPSSVPAFKG